MKFRPIFFLLSFSLIVISIYSIVTWGFRTSIDFAGGTIWEIQTPVASADDLRQIFADSELETSINELPESRYLLKFENISQEKRQELEGKIMEKDPEYRQLRFETLGPSLGRELLKKTVYAIILSSITLLFFIGKKFKEYSFGMAAILAMFHDTIILIGVFSLFGHFFGAELDTLFVTAVLTTLSSSVHDTVVIFDRIRELKRNSYQSSWVDLANQAITETLTRSINNSMTIIFMLFALVVLGGEITRWFALALLVGTVLGTYSSTGVAIPLILVFKKDKK
ncbi:MAG: protein translocase subunit SecF [Patescibacteria group bacterium]